MYEISASSSLSVQCVGHMERKDPPDDPQVRPLSVFARRIFVYLAGGSLHIHVYVQSDLHAQKILFDVIYCVYTFNSHAKHIHTPGGIICKDMY